jgi:4-hydroxybenzoate polyprenyltransferase
VLDIVADSTIYGITAFILGWIAAGGIIGWMMWKFSLPYFFLMMAGALNQAIPDMDDDKTTGKITTAVKFGKKKISIFSTIALFLVIFISVLLNDYICMVMGIVSLPFFLKAFVSGKKSDFLRSYHIPGPFIILMAGLQFPPLLIAAVIIFAGSRWYYPRRFGVDYPKVGF